MIRVFRSNLGLTCRVGPCVVGFVESELSVVDPAEFQSKLQSSCIQTQVVAS